MLEGKKILVVDDEEVVLAAVKRILKRDGCVLHLEGRARAALRRLESEKYDLIITDRMMPDIDGIRFIEWVRSTCGMIRVIVITGMPTIQTALRARRLGALEYVTKPFRRRELRSVVVRTLREPRRLGCLTPPEPGGLADSRFHIPGQCWAEVGRDGAVELGICGFFLEAAGPSKSLELPCPGDLLAQGSPFMTYLASDGLKHDIWAPLSGEVIEVREGAGGTEQARGDGSRCGPGILCMRPFDLKSELDFLDQE